MTPQDQTRTHDTTPDPLKAFTLFELDRLKSPRECRCYRADAVDTAFAAERAAHAAQLSAKDARIADLERSLEQFHEEVRLVDSLHKQVLQQESEIARLTKECRVRDLSTPIEEELNERIETMCKHLAMRDGFTLDGIAQLLVACQQRMVADWLEVGDQRREIARLKAEANNFHMAYRARCDEQTKAAHIEVERLKSRQADETSNGCTFYLKDGETPAECIKRNRDDVDTALSMLAKEQRTVAAQTEEIERLKAEVGRLKGEPDCLGVLDALTMQTQAVDIYVGWLGEVRRVAQAWFGDDAQRVDGAGFAKWLDRQIEPRINAAYSRGEAAGLREGFEAGRNADDVYEEGARVGWSFDLRGYALPSLRRMDSAEAFAAFLAQRTEAKQA